MTRKPINPCIYPPTDPRYIPLDELHNATLDQKISYRIASAREWQNYIEEEKIRVEDRKIDKLIRIGKISFLGTVLASIIGSSVLLFINIERKDTIPYKIERINKNLEIINQNLDILHKKQNKLYYNQVEVWGIMEKINIAHSKNKINGLIKESK